MHTSLLQLLYSFNFEFRSLYNLMRILRHDRVAYLRGGHFLFLLEFQGEQRFANTNIAVRRVIVFEATVETLVSEALIAVAVTRQLRERHRYLSRGPISIARNAGEGTRIECWSKAGLARRYFKMRRQGFCRGAG